jgi:Zn-dependent metalloprotease
MAERLPVGLFPFVGRMKEGNDMPDDWGKGKDRKSGLQEEKYRDTFEKLRAGNSKIRIQLDKKRGVVSSISRIQPKSRELEHGSPGDEKDQMSSFLEEQQDIFGLRNSKEELSWDQELLEETGGDAWLGLRQLHQGIPVHGASMWAWFSRAAGGRMLNQISNKCVPDIDIDDVTPKLSVAEAFGKALERYWPGKLESVKKATRYFGLPLEPEPSLEIVEQEGFRLCHVVKVPAEKNGIRRVMTCYIDALTGDFLFAYDGLRSGQGKGYYTTSRRAGPLQTLPSLEEDGKHKLIDKSRPGGPTITIYALSSPDLNQISEDGLDISPSLSQKEISCGANGIWNRTSQDDRKNDQRPEVDAMLYAGQIVDYFRDTHHWNSFNGAGHEVKIAVHWGKDLNGACFDTHMQAIYLGDGDGRLCGFWTTRDVIAHEFTHGITHHTAGFFSREEQIDKRRSYQYSALDEAFSDIFALFINWPDEEIGTQLIRDNSDGEDSLALMKPGRPWDRNQIVRFLEDDTPEKGMIINHVLKACDFKSNRGFDNEEDPHINAGIIEYAAYLMIKGGTHPGSKIKVEGIGKEAAERLFFRALTKWIGLKNGNATFMECRKALCDAVTKDLHKNDPASAFILESVKNAFTAVGIGPDLYIPCKKHDDASRNPAAPLPDASHYIEILAAGSPEQQQRRGGAYDIYVTVRNRGTNPDETQFTVSVFWENPAGDSSDAILMPIGSIRDAIDSRVSKEEVGPVSEMRVGPIRWPADRLPDRSPVRIICMVDGYDDDPEPEMELIRSVEAVDRYLKSSNNFAWRNFPC